MRKLHVSIIWIIVGIAVVAGIAALLVRYIRRVHYMRDVYHPAHITIRSIESHFQYHQYEKCIENGAQLPLEAPRGLEKELANARTLVTNAKEILAASSAKKKAYQDERSAEAVVTLDRIMDMTDPHDRFVAMQQFLRHDYYRYLADASQQRVRTELNALMASERERLLVEARSGSTTAFEELRLLESYQTMHFPHEQFIYPNDWNDLVALHRDAPVIGDFCGIGKPSPGEIVALAGTVLMDGNLTKAQIVLAWAQVSERVWSDIVFPYRDAMKGHLIADLTKLVAKRRREEFARRASEASIQMT